MHRLDIPFHKINIERSTIESVFWAIGEKSAEFPHIPVSILSISNLLRLDPSVIKESFMILHLYGYLKATFLPRCKICDKVIGPAEESAELIYEKAEMGEYDYCVGCTELIHGKDDIEIELLFWLPQYDKQ